MAAAGGMGTVKVGIIRIMTADTGARRTTDAMACGCTMDSKSTHTVCTGTITETAVRAWLGRVDMAVLTVCVSCTGSVVDIRNDIRAAMTAGTLGRPGKICRMPGVSGCGVMVGEVGVVSTMASQTAGVPIQGTLLDRSSVCKATRDTAFTPGIARIASSWFGFARIRMPLAPTRMVESTVAPSASSALRCMLCSLLIIDA